MISRAGVGAPRLRAVAYAVPSLGAVPNRLVVVHTRSARPPLSVTTVAAASDGSPPDVCCGALPGVLGMPDVGCFEAGNVPSSRVECSQPYVPRAVPMVLRQRYVGSCVSRADDPLTIQRDPTFVSANASLGWSSLPHLTFCSAVTIRPV